MAYIIVRRGPDQGKLIPLTAEEVKIGRGSKNDIVILDNDVSREHIRLARTTGGYELHDITPNSGTFVNGLRVDDVWLLQSACIIELGEMVLLEYRPGDPQKDPTHELVGATPHTGDGAQTYLVVTVSSQPEPAIYPLDGASLKVGRGTTNDVVIVEPEMSREHFSLTLTGQHYTIADLGSTNGTLVNGEFVTEPHLLQPNDIIQIGTMVQIRYTTNPERFLTRVKTDVLLDPVDTQAAQQLRKPRATSTEMPHLVSVENTSGTVPETKPTLEDKVLVSYSRDDWERIVATLVDQLHHADIDVWVDQYLPRGESEWRAATEQARLECWALVVVVSRAALESELVNKNWRHFHNREKPIILVILDVVDRLPAGVEKLMRIQYNPAVPDTAYQQLIAELKRIRSQRDSS